MREIKENTCPTVGAVEQAEMGNGLANDTSRAHFTSIPSVGQFKISDLLSPGQENALPLRHLVKITGQDGRIVRRRIAAERLAGIPILSDCKNGYYLPATATEARKCVRSMRNRAREIAKATAAVESATGEV